MSAEPNEIEEQRIATLVHPDEYRKSPNQVATLSTERILFVKRKELSFKPFELVYFPVADCSAIAYEMKYAVFRMIFGGLLVALIVLFFLTGLVPAGTSVPIGLIGLAAIIGVNLVIGVKRHKLTFVVQGRKLNWHSKAGDFKYKVASVNQVVAFAKDHGLLKSSMP